MAESDSEKSGEPPSPSPASSPVGPQQVYAGLISTRNNETNLRMNRSNASILLNTTGIGAIAFRLAMAIPPGRHELVLYVIVGVLAAGANWAWGQVVRRSTRLIVLDDELLGDMEKSTEYDSKIKLFSNPKYHSIRGGLLSFGKVWRHYTTWVIFGWVAIVIVSLLKR